MATITSSLNRATMNLKAKKASMFLPLKSNSTATGDYDDSGVSTSTTATSSPNSFVSNKSIISQNGLSNLITNVPTFKPSAKVANSIYSPVSPISPFNSLDLDYEFDLASTPINKGKYVWSPDQTLSSVSQTWSNVQLSRSKNSYSSYSNSSCSTSASDCPVCTSCCSFSDKSRKVIRDDDSILSTSDEKPSEEEFEALIDMAEKIYRSLRIPDASLSRSSNSSAFLGTKCCKFCKSNNEPKEFYLSHSTRNEKNEVICPILQNYRCPICNLLGHTRSYCTYSQIIRNGVNDPNITYEFYNMGSLKGNVN